MFISLFSICCRYVITVSGHNFNSGHWPCCVNTYSWIKMFNKKKEEKKEGFQYDLIMAGDQPIRGLDQYDLIMAGDQPIRGLDQYDLIMAGDQPIRGLDQYDLIMAGDQPIRGLDQYDLIMAGDQPIRGLDQYDLILVTSQSEGLTSMIS